MVCWAAGGVRLIAAGVLLGALCLLAGSTPALILLFLSLPRGTLASHPPGSAFIWPAAKPPGPDWRSLAGVYALPFGYILAPASFLAACVSPSLQMPFPTDPGGHSQTSASSFAPLLLSDHHQAFMVKRRTPKRIHPFGGSKCSQGGGFGEGRGGTASLPWRDALQGDSFCVPCPSEPLLCLLLVMEMIYGPGQALELFGETLFSGQKCEENKRIGL